MYCRGSQDRPPLPKSLFIVEGHRTGLGHRSSEGDLPQTGCMSPWLRPWTGPLASLGWGRVPGLGLQDSQKRCGVTKAAWTWSLGLVSSRLGQGMVLADMPSHRGPNPRNAWAAELKQLG